LIRKTLLLPGVAIAVAMLTLLGATDTQAQTFNPTITTELADPSAGANSDFTSEFVVPLGDVNFGAAVFFIPNEWGITPADEVPVGAVVGQLTALATLGLINAQCDNQLQVQFNMMNASVDITDTVEFSDADDNGTGDVFEDKDESGLQDAFEKWPAFINRITGDAQPVRRAAGIEIVAGVDVLLQFVIFEPGTSIIREIPSEEDLGYPTVTFLQAIGDPDAVPEPGAITDFCTPLTSSNVTFGVSKDNPCTDVEGATLDPVCDVKSVTLDIPDEGVSDPDESGHALFTNPAEGTYNFSTIALGQRDADGDSFENTLDTCPFDPNEGNPREKGSGDFDEDGLDVVCDPNDEETNSDQDLDGYLNRQDNCPLIANGEAEDNQADSDTNPEGDARPDAIGDACDTDPETPNGEVPFVQAESEVTIGPGTGDGQATAEPTAEPDGGEDDDDDGGSTLLIIIIVVVVAVIVVGGGAFLLMRGRGGGGAGPAAGGGGGDAGGGGPPTA
jgi:hypothetical protein